MSRRTQFDITALRTLWAAGVSYRDIAAALGCSEGTVHDLKERYKLPPRKRRLRPGYEVDPTPEQIAERAAEQRAKRNTPPPPPERVEIKEYSWDGVAFVGRA